jgi:hypothetical protein
MRKLRLAAAAMIASLACTGGGMLLGVGTAAASNAGGGQTCLNFSGTADLSQSVPVVTGILSGCNSNRDGTLSAVVDVSGGVTPASIAWDTGKATSVGTIQVTNIDFSGAGCPAGDIAATLDLEITGGPYEGTGGPSNMACADISNFPIVAFTNLGPFKL